MPSWYHNLRKILTESLSLNLTKRTSLFYILLFTVIAIIDSTIVKFSIYAETDFPISTNVVIFTLLYLLFAMMGVILLNSMRKGIFGSGKKLSTGIGIFQNIAYAVQVLMIAIILTIILQILLIHQYDLRLLQAATILTHLSAVTFLIVLVSTFIRWFTSRKNYITILYMVSFALISTSIIISLIYLEYHYSISFSHSRKPYSIQNYVQRQETGSFPESLATAFDITYLLSFISIWLATASLLSQYRYKIGRIKYFTFIGIPLIYYLFTFEVYFGNIFSELVLSSPVTFGVTYTLIFSATKQIGALLFSLAFLVASALVTNERVRKSSLISALGVAILFGSIEITTLQYRLYPPFGLITDAFMPLGAYLLLAGIFTSATSVARDANLRKEFYKSAMSQFNLLKTIGVIQMEKELLKEYKPVLARSIELKETEYQPLEQSEVKEMIHDVLEEVQARQKKLANNGTS